MVGVTSPLFRGGDVRGGFALAGWYVVGTAISAAVILFGVSVLSLGAVAVPTGVRGALLAACVGVLLVLDVFGRTPHTNRQTPQRMRLASPSARGFIWGLDIGVLFTTIKVTSLVWVLLLLGIVDPDRAPLAIAVFYATYLLTEAVAVVVDLSLGPQVFLVMQGKGFQYAARTLSVILLVPVAMAAYTGAFW
jgi:hypothetical protein